MRHRKSGRHLNRTSAHRKAMFRNMTASLVAHEVIRTTVPRGEGAAAGRGAADHARQARPSFAAADGLQRIRNREAVTKLFNELGPRYRDRPGGYVRILRHGLRAGDAAPMAVVELVDRPLPDEREE